MAKQRYIKDSFWTDPYIEKLSPDYKLVFLYLLTNPLCNIAGVYEIRLKRMAFETGYDPEIVENILKRFIADKKLLMVDSWVIIVNHLKHQYLGSKTAEGINRIIQETPESVKSLFSMEIIENDKETYEVFTLNEIPHTYPIQGVSKVPYSEVKLSIVKLSTNKVEKSNYGEFKNVKLSLEDYSKLISKLGQQQTDSLVEELSGYIASKGKKYASHYATLQNWARMKAQKQHSRGKSVSIID